MRVCVCVCAHDLVVKFNPWMRWYHCCEYRPPYGSFSHRTPPPKLEAEDISLGSMAMKFASGLFSRKARGEEIKRAKCRLG